MKQNDVVYRISPRAKKLLEILDEYEVPSEIRFSMVNDILGIFKNESK